MEIIDMDIGLIKPYEKNPRNNDEAVEKVANSIKEFGFKVPIVIDKENVIVAGHTRYKASVKLGLKQVPCIVADDLNEEQVKAFRLADNKVGELATWDDDLLLKELDDIINIDMEDFGFLDAVEDIEEEKEQAKEKYNESLYAMDNFDAYDEDRTEGFYDMPKLKPTKHIPTGFIPFNYLLQSKEFTKGIHFYKDDYRFERIWNRPEFYIEKMKQFDCAMTPDFSLYLDMPMAQKVWNVYRSRLIGQMMQDEGIAVIPTLQWAEEETFKFCFDGLPKNSVVSVSTVGVKCSKESMEVWKKGMDEAMERLKPCAVVCYGGKIDYDFKEAKVIYVDANILGSDANG